MRTIFGGSRVRPHVAAAAGGALGRQAVGGCICVCVCVCELVCVQDFKISCYCV